ncbi:MAG: hypothetical protein V7K35_28770 [Nostoc sp.]|uniref:hypothetical protein n=1 Tax=Nostoc sp. TaxID=1180 RepID=UPI002FF93DE7
MDYRSRAKNFAFNSTKQAQTHTNALTEVLRGDRLGYFSIPNISYLSTDNTTSKEL